MTSIKINKEIRCKLDYLKKSKNRVYDINDYEYSDLEVLNWLIEISLYSK